jgi:hypothetical protein
MVLLPDDVDPNPDKPELNIETFSFLQHVVR